MNICFLARPSFDKYSAAIFNTLKNDFDKDAKGFFITSNEKETNYIKKTVPGGLIFETSKFLSQHWNQYSVSDLIEVEKKYDCAPIWQFIYSDRFLINRDYQYCINVTVGLFNFFETIFSNNHIDFYYSETIATLQCYIAYIVGKKYGVKYICQMTARGLDSTHHYFIMDEFMGNALFHDDYQKFDYSEEEIKRADKFLKEFESKDVPPKNMVFTGKRPKFRFKFFVYPLIRFLKSFDKSLNDPCSYMYYESYKNITNPVYFYFRYQLAKKYYNKADTNIKYVYYPLHYQPEASTIVCAQKYEKQLFFIDSWAKSLPADTKLYVKEHYALLGHRDLSFYEELKKYPNVVLIDPWENSRKLIEGSVAVTTLTGTAGWEAMLLRKPVFIGGNIFFDNAPGVIKIKDIYLDYLTQMQRWKKPDRDQVVKYLCEYFRTIFKGNVYSANPACLEQDNIIDIVKSLYKQAIKILVKEKEDASRYAKT